MGNRQATGQAPQQQAPRQGPIVYAPPGLGPIDEAEEAREEVAISREGSLMSLIQVEELSLNEDSCPRDVIIGNNRIDQLDREGLTIDLNSFIASGAFGGVYRGTCQGQPSAVKVIALERLRLKAKHYEAVDLPRELSIIRRMNHPNIITVFRVFEANYGLTDDAVIIFMELAQEGDLAHVVHRMRNAGAAPDEGQIKHWFRQIADGLEYMHSIRWAHRDLKSQNCLVFDGDIVKLTDFSLSRSVYEGKTLVRSQTFCGTRRYISPEVLSRQEYDPLANDVWALGIILFELFNAKTPFGGPRFAPHSISLMVGYMNQSNLDWEPQVLASIDPLCLDLIMSILDPSPAKRLSIRRVVNHPWIRGLRSRTESSGYHSASGLTASGQSTSGGQQGQGQGQGQGWGQGQVGARISNLFNRLRH